ncbi:alpha/beta fold hydrolase [Candidatus Saccharibacteria bacterium]|nr:alpha/beta fold hydrolase [Candidatus Saccharibacteria bacterium]
MVKQRALFALIITASLGSLALAIFGVTSFTKPEPDGDEPNPAAIEAVRLHPLTPGVIAAVKTVAPRAGCPTNIVSFHSDGLTQYALATRPVAAMPRGGYPVIIFAHGYTDSKTYKTDNTQYQAMIESYCQHGYLILKPDYRGVGSSQGVASNGLFSPDDTYDVLNLAASMPTYPLANPSRIVLIGHSMGGAIILRAGVAPHNMPIRGLITIAGAVDSLPNLAFHWTGRVPPDVAIKRRQVLGAEGPPSQNPAYWHDASSINYVSSLSVPVQINQGLTDVSVPPAFAAKLNLALTAAGKTHEYFTYPDTGHLFVNPTGLSDLLKNNNAFLAAYDS